MTSRTLPDVRDQKGPSGASLTYIVLKLYFFFSFFLSIGPGSLVQILTSCLERLAASSHLQASTFGLMTCDAAQCRRGNLARTGRHRIYGAGARVRLRGGPWGAWLTDCLPWNQPDSLRGSCSVR